MEPGYSSEPSRNLKLALRRRLCIAVVEAAVSSRLICTNVWTAVGDHLTVQITYMVTIRVYNEAYPLL